MSRDGNGNFTNPYPDFVGGTIISSSEVDANNSDMATALTQSIAVDGQSTITGNIPMFTYKFTGLGAGSASTDSLTLGQAQANAYTYQGTDSGAADAYVIALVPSISAQGAGLRVSFVAANSSTGPSTLDAGVGPDAIEYQGAAFGGAEIAAGATIVCEHDGTAWQMTSPSALLVDTSGLVSADIGVTVQGYDADTLFADEDDILTAGFAGTDDDDGTQSSGTYTPTYTGGNYKNIVNNGAFILAPQVNTSTLLIDITNGASAGAVTVSGWTVPPTGDALTTTNGHKFKCYATFSDGTSHLHIVAMQ
jgi:hypothetical protein